MKKIAIILSVFTVFVCISCGSSSQTSTVNPHAEAHLDAHQNFIYEEKQKTMNENYIKEIAGTYSGMIPCADCEKISYKIELNEDMTYRLAYTYMGKSDNPIEKSGTYHLTDRLLIQLDNAANGMNFMKKQPYGLLLLDKNGHEISGDLADKYQLLPLSDNTKTNTTSASEQLLIKKWQDGIDFYAFGNEPSWALEMDFEKLIHFKNMNGVDFNAPAVEPVKAMDANVSRYRSTTETGEIIVQLNKSKCIDNMSGKSFNYSVSVDYKKTNDTDYQNFKGCGNYIPDVRLNDIWAITQVEDIIINPMDFKMEIPRLELNTFKGTAFGHDGCNSFSGSLEVENNSIIFGNMASTMRACSENTEISSKIGKVLSGKSITFKIENNYLWLFEEGQKIMTLKHID